MTKRQTMIRAPRDVDKGHFSCSRKPPQDKRLSWEARGVLWYLLSQPSDWEVNPKNLAQNCGRDKAYKIIKELESFGYLRKETVRDAKGKFIEHYHTIHELPFTENQEVDSPSPSPLPENPDTANPDTANQDTYSLKENLTEKDEVTETRPPAQESQTDPSADESTKESSSSVLADVIKVYEQNINLITPAIVMGSPAVMGIQDAIDTYTPAWVTEAIQLSAIRNKKSWGYALGILRRWNESGKDAPAKPTNGNGAGENQQPRYKLVRSHEDCPKCQGGWISTPDGMERCSECWQRVEVQAVANG